MNRDTNIVRHTLSVIVDNEPGVLARVIGLFSGRGYNIESLSVAEVDKRVHQSRITIVTSGTPQVIDQIQAQLGRLVPIHRVVDLTLERPGVARELALVKIAGTPAKRSAAKRTARSAGAKQVDVTGNSIVFSLVDPPEKIDAFVEALRKQGLVEVARTGVAAVGKGAQKT
jgi:acetolactate synthase-1/3 small subunit